MEIKEGKMKPVCAKEQKLIGEVNNLPSLHRVETKHNNKMIYLKISFLTLLADLNFNFSEVQDLAKETSFPCCLWHEKTSLLMTRNY